MATHQTHRDVRPEWFKLEKYESQKTLDLPGWLLQFGFRRDLQTHIAAHRERNTDCLEDELVREMLRMTQDKPILRLKDVVSQFGSLLVRAVFPSIAVLVDPQPRNHMGVHPTTVEELYRVHANLLPEVQNHADETFEELEQGIEDQRGTLDFALELDNRLHQRKLALIRAEELAGKPPLPYAPLLWHPIYCSDGICAQKTLFTANLSLPDTLLVEQFRDSLGRARSYVSKVDPFAARLPKDFSKVWIERQLLAFIDLYLGMQLPDNTKISRPEMAELLWPSLRYEVDPRGNSAGWDEQTVKETLEPLAQEMLADHSDIFWMLEAASASELADQNLDKQPPEGMVGNMEKPKTRRRRGENK